MRASLGSIFVAAAVVSSFVCSAQAGPIFAEPDPASPANGFVLSFGSATLGMDVIDGYRTLDGKNFFHDGSSLRLSSGAAIPAFFGASDDKGASRATFSFGSPVSNSTLSRPEGNGSAGGLGIGGGAGGGGGLGFGGSPNGFTVGGGSPGKGLSPLELVYLNLGGSSQEFSEGSGEKAEIGATPLPPSWTLMLLGLCCIGWLARRIRRNEKVFAAA